MTREEAQTILGVEADTGTEETKKKYNELYNDYQLRLTNAPTPNLKKLYQSNLKELNEALDTLLDGHTDGILKDLPSSTPVYGRGNERKNPATVPKSPSATRRTPGKNSSRKYEEEAGRYRKLFGIFLILAVIALAGLALLGILLGQSKSRNSELAGKIPELEVLRAANAALNDELTPFRNGQFKIRNFGDSPLKITWAIITYREEDGTFRKFENYLNKTIRPGGVEEFNQVSGGTVTWNGEVISYACELEYRGSKFIQSGLWTGDSRDGFLAINLENFK